MNNPTLTLDDARDLARDLANELAETPSNPQAVSATLNAWADAYPVGDFAVLCMAALRFTYAECLHEPAKLPDPNRPAHEWRAPQEDQ